jgi:hypothetical protein
MSDKALLFMPDISGFTEFVGETETSHSGHIISELLEILLESNPLSLELAEIEGDALFMYKNAELPTFDALMAQVKKMYVAFHEHLNLYKFKRICDCGACSTANKLTLKFVAHIAPIDFIEVHGSRKPYGPGVIKVHRLLKNKIENDEYLLLSKGSAEEITINEAEFEVKNYQSVYDSQEVDYVGIDISKFKSEVLDLPKVVYNRPKTKLVSMVVDVKAPMADVYEFASNLRFRMLWTKSLDGIEYDKNRLNRAGTKHNCVVGQNQVEFETMPHGGATGQLIYSERTTSAPFAKVIDSYSVFTETASGTRVEISIYVELKKYRGWAKGLLASVLKKSLKKNMLAFKTLIEEKGLDQLYAETS